MNCNYCKSQCIKKGIQKNGIQKFLCKSCNKYQQAFYKNKACEITTNKLLVHLICNSCGIRSCARVMNIAVNTVVSRIKIIAKAIQMPTTFYKERTYEVDELKTFVGKKANEYWVCCSLDKETKSVVSMSVGKRNKTTLLKALKPILLSKPKRVHTDKLIHYKVLINCAIHSIKQHSINYIERKFLNFRTHLKRLGRKTICFSKNAFMLEAIVKIYLWHTRLIFQ